MSRCRGTLINPKALAVGVSELKHVSASPLQVSLTVIECSDCQAQRATSASNLLKAESRRSAWKRNTPKVVRCRMGGKKTTTQAIKKIVFTRKSLLLESFYCSPWPHTAARVCYTLHKRLRFLSGHLCFLSPAFERRVCPSVIGTPGWYAATSTLMTLNPGAFSFSKCVLFMLYFQIRHRGTDINYAILRIADICFWLRFCEVCTFAHNCCTTKCVIFIHINPLIHVLGTFCISSWCSASTVTKVSVGNRINTLNKFNYGA